MKKVNIKKNKDSTQRVYSALLPKGTAAWLIDNTILTFQQIANFCGLHPLEISGMADGDVHADVAPVDPIRMGQLTAEEIKRCEANPDATLSLSAGMLQTIKQANNSDGKYVPVARRHDKPSAIIWLLRHVRMITTADIVKLIGTTKKMIGSIKDRSHWNYGNIQERDPVVLGLCSQVDLDHLRKICDNRRSSIDSDDVSEDN